MLRPLATFVDDVRIWHKITFQRGRILETAGDAWEAYDRPEHYAEPEGFYGADGVVPDLATLPAEPASEAASGRARVARLAGARLTGNGSDPRARVERFAFPSLHPLLGYPYPESDTASGRFYWHRDPSAPVVVLAHGWAHDTIHPVEVVYVEPLLRAGFSVAVPFLPLHFDRTPAGFWSGELMVTGDVVLTVEAFRQGARDLSALVSWLEARGHARVGLLGYSLGGYVAGIVACLRDDLDFVVVAGAGDSVISPILDTMLGVNVREDLSWTGMDRRENLERAWGVISPGRLRLRVPREGVLLVAGLHDRIMLASSVRRLWEGWDRPAILWEPEGHYSLLAVPGRVVRRSLPFLEARARRA